MAAPLGRPRRQPMRVRIDSRSKAHEPMTSTTPISPHQQVADQDLVMVKVACPPKNCATATPMIGITTKPPICWAVRASLTRLLTTMPSSTLKQADERHQGHHRDQPRVAEDEARQPRVGDRAVDQAVGDEDAPGRDAPPAAPRRSSCRRAARGTSIGVASCGSSERACFSPITDCVAIAIGTMAGMRRK